MWRDISICTSGNVHKIFNLWRSNFTVYSIYITLKVS